MGDNEHGPQELVDGLVRFTAKLGTYPHVGFGLLVAATLFGLALGAQIEYLFGDAFCCVLFVKYVLLSRRPRTLKLGLAPAAVVCLLCWTMQVVSGGSIPGKLVAAASVWAWFFTILTCSILLEGSGGEKHRD